MNEITNLCQDEDTNLMVRVRGGDEAAFRILFQRYAPVLVGFVDRFFHNRAQSEEVVQEVFLRIYKARKRYEPRSKFATWLYTIATRASLNQLRRNRPGRQQTLDDTGKSDGKAIASMVPGPSEVMEARCLQGVLQQAMDELPSNQRAALILVRFGGRSYLEVAEILQTTESAVKSLMFRATEELARAVKVYQQGAAIPNDRSDRGRQATGRVEG